MLATAFTDLVGCQVPIQQAPMGGISPPALARWPSAVREVLAAFPCSRAPPWLTSLPNLTA